MGVQTQESKGTKTEMPSQRISYIDICKGVGILLVLIAHAMDKNTYVWNAITLFHIPFFYFVTGFLFKKRSLKTYFKSIIIRLYLPYITISMGTYVYLCLFENNTFSIISILRMLFLFYTPGLIGASWFISVLIYADIFFAMIIFVLDKLKTRKLYVLLILFCAIGLIGFCTNFPLGISRIIVAIFFISIGFMAQNETIKSIAQSQRRIVVIVLFSLILLLLSAIKNYSSYSSNIFSSIPISIVAAICGIVDFVCLSKLIDKKNTIIKKILMYLGSNTMGIIFFQFISFRIVNYLITIVYRLDKSRVFDFPVNYDYNNYFWQLAYVLIGMIVSIIAYIPFKVLFDKISTRILQK